MSQFKISPAKAYTKPSYPSPIKKALLSGAAVAVTAGMGILSSGCIPPTPWEQHDIMDGVAVECLPGDLQCVDDNTIQYCSNDEGYDHWETLNCTDYCHEEFGWDYSPWGICTEEISDNPCQCEYDIIDGGIGYCDENDFYCGDENTINVCNDSQTDYINITCNDYCAEQWGSEMFLSAGTCSDDQTEDPCNCYYGMMDGMIAECTPEDVICVSDLAVGVCDDNGVDYNYLKCDDVCKAQDPLSYSAGCDAAELDDPCLCETPSKK